MFFFYGPSGTGKKLAAEACCKEFWVNLLIVDAGDFPKGEEEEALILILREALLQKGAVFIQNFDSLLNRSQQGQEVDSSLSGHGISGSSLFNAGLPGSSISGILRQLDSFPGTVFLSAGQL